MFSQDPHFRREASGIQFYTDFDSFLESFWEPSLLTYSLLVAPVAKIVDIVDVFFSSCERWA